MLRRMLFRSIRRSLGRYLAILCIIALGVGVFVGLRVSRDAMIQTGNTYFADQNFFDYRLLSTLGFDEHSAEDFLSIEGISAAEGAISTDFLTRLGENEIVLRAHSLPQQINLLSLVSGRLPSAPDECVVDVALFPQDPIGMQIPISPSNEEDTRELFAYESYTVVGTIISPTYINFERGTTSIGSGTLAGFLYLPHEGFDADYVTEIYLKIAHTEEIYTDSYKALLEHYEPLVEAQLERTAQGRFDRIYDEARAEIDDGAAELADARAEYLEKRAETEAELADAKQQLADAAIELADARKELDEAYEQLDDLDHAQDEYNYYSELLRETDASLAEGEAEYQKNYEAYLQGLADLEAGEAEAAARFAEAEAELQAAEDALNDAKQQEDPAIYQQLQLLREQIELLTAAGQLEMAAMLQAQLDQATAVIAAGNAQLHTAQMQLYKAKQTYQAEKQAAEEELAAARAELEDAGRQLAEARQTLDGYYADREALADAVRMLSEYDGMAVEVRQELADAELELAENQALYEEKLQEYEDGLIEAEEGFAEAELEIADAEAELADAYDELATIETATTYALGRETNVGYACFESDTLIVQGVSKVFPIFFFLIAALVCLTTMTRMIDDERTQIGVLKALGFSSRSIMANYMIYSCSASLIGCLIGFLVGSWGFPKVVWLAYGMMYAYPTGIELLLDWPLAAFCAVLFLFCVILATWSSCRGTLRAQAAELIRPLAPKSGKRILLERITPLWRRLKFLHKVSVRNIFRYRKRLFMMMLGIGGCTGLLLTGFGLSDSVRGLVGIQFSEITHYDFSVTLTDPADESVQAAILDAAAGEIESSIFFSTLTVDATANGLTKSVTCIVTDEAMRPFNSFRHDGADVPYPGAGEAMLDEDLAERLELSIGDTFTVRDADMRSLTLKVSGLFENHMSHYIYISPETCLAAWGETPEMKSAHIIVREGSDVHAVAADVSSCEFTAAVSVNEDTRERVSTMLSALDYVVLLVIFCAGALALIVLYNLTNINITERIREIATIKVLGFTGGETASYVFRENVILTAIGTLVGIPLGRLLHWYVMEQINVDFVNFVVKVDASSYLASVGLTFAFAMLVNFLMYFRLQRIDMAESLKSIE